MHAKVPDHITSLGQLHRFLKLPSPSHPLISVFDFDDVGVDPTTLLSSLVTDFYIVAMKKDCAGKFKYGQNYYDFESGIMYFIAPNQVMKFEDILLSEVRGSVLVVHPDFLYGFSLSKEIKGYGYFSYSSHEALYLPEKEEESLIQILNNIQKEIDSNLDSFTQGLIVSNIELLLKYCDRYYNRQFLTRKKINSDLLEQLESLLDESFQEENLLENGIPTVQWVADQLHLSPSYLGDLLKVQTGLSTKQFIQNRVIEKGKVLLSTTKLSVSEIAYLLGFEHPQSFHRIFKRYNQLSPLEFRQTFN